MSQDSFDNDDEQKLFQREVKGVTPLTQDRIEPWSKRPSPRPLRHTTIREETPPAYTQETSGENELLYARPGVQRKLIKELRRGRIRREMELDLHGMTAARAEDTLSRFIVECQEQKVRCIQIIHGKGYGSDNRQPVLKRMVNSWLRQQKEILAFCSATPRDGGTGAVYVLVRSPKKRQR